MMSAAQLYNIPEKTRAKALPRQKWSSLLPARNTKTASTLDDLAARVDAQHDRIAALMRERNAHPEDEALKQKLSHAFDELLLMEREHAMALRAHYSDSFPVLSDEDKQLLDEARRILKAHENPSSDDTSL